MKPACSQQRLQKLLQKDSTAQECDAERAWIGKIDALKDFAHNAPAFSEEKIALLQLRRASVSNSLLNSPEAIAHWNQAQKLLLGWVESDRIIGIDDLLQLNAVVSGKEQRGWRTVDMYTTRVKHVSPRLLDKAMQDFWHYFESVARSKHVIYTAFVCRYCILSIHPFLEANGRTSQLFADYFLLKHGYLPQAFTSKLEAFIIADPDSKPYNTPHEGLKRFCQTIINAYKICLS